MEALLVEYHLRGDKMTFMLRGNKQIISDHKKRILETNSLEDFEELLDEQNNKYKNGVDLKVCLILNHTLTNTLNRQKVFWCFFQMISKISS